MDVAHTHGLVLVPRANPGGTATSTLALVLEFQMRQEALIIEIGGNRCPALGNRGEGGHAHFSSHDEGTIEHTMDLRLAHPGRAAILEFELAPYTETLNLAAKMSELDAGFAPTIFHVCAKHKLQPRYEKNAIARQIGQTIICHSATRDLARAKVGHTRFWGIFRLPIRKLQQPSCRDMQLC